MRVALFDFCDTIVNFQTGDEYIYYTQEYLKLKGFRHNYMKYPFIKRKCEKNWRKKKRAILYQLKGLSETKLKDAAGRYYIEVVRPNIYTAVVNEILNCKKSGYSVYLVSAGYEIYLDYFAQEFGIDGIISNEFQYRNGIFSGHLTREDCYGQNKVDRLNDFFGGLKIEHSVSYSDSISDLPMLKWADDGVVVSRDHRRKWVSENGFKDFVLSEHGKELLGNVHGRIDGE